MWGLSRILEGQNKNSTLGNLYFCIHLLLNQSSQLSKNKAPPLGWFRADLSYAEISPTWLFAVKSSSGRLCGTLKTNYNDVLTVRFTQHILGTPWSLSAQPISHVVLMSRTGTDFKKIRRCKKQFESREAGESEVALINLMITPHMLNGKKVLGDDSAPRDMWREK